VADGKEGEDGAVVEVEEEEAEEDLGGEYLVHAEQLVIPAADYSH